MVSNRSLRKYEQGTMPRASIRMLCISKNTSLWHLPARTPVTPQRGGLPLGLWSLDNNSSRPLRFGLQRRQKAQAKCYCVCPARRPDLSASSVSKVGRVTSIELFSAISNLHHCLSPP